MVGLNFDTMSNSNTMLVIPQQRVAVKAAANRPWQLELWTKKLRQGRSTWWDGNVPAPRSLRAAGTAEVRWAGRRALGGCTGAPEVRRPRTRELQVQADAVAKVRLAAGAGHCVVRRSGNCRAPREHARSQSEGPVEGACWSFAVGPKPRRRFVQSPWVRPPWSSAIPRTVSTAVSAETGCPENRPDKNSRSSGTVKQVGGCSRWQLSTRPISCGGQCPEHAPDLAHLVPHPCRTRL